MWICASLKKYVKCFATSELGGKVQRCALFDTWLFNIGTEVDQSAYGGRAIPLSGHSKASVVVAEGYVDIDKSGE